MCSATERLLLSLSEKLLFFFWVESQQDALEEALGPVQLGSEIFFFWKAYCVSLSDHMLFGLKANMMSLSDHMFNFSSAKIPRKKGPTKLSFSASKINKLSFFGLPGFWKLYVKFALCFSFGFYCREVAMKLRQTCYMLSRQLRAARDRMRLKLRSPSILCLYVQFIN